MSAPVGDPARRASKRWILAIAAILLILVGALGWLVRTQSGARWAITRVQSILSGKLAVRELRGTLWGPVDLSHLRWFDAASGVEVQIERAQLRWRLKHAWPLALEVEALSTRGVDVHIFAHPPKPPSPPVSLAAPFDLSIKRLALERGRVRLGDEQILVINSAQLAAHWTDAGISIEQFVLDSPDGRIQLNGTVGREPQYEGRADGEFHWRIGERLIAGSLAASSRGQTLRSEVRLSEPFAAQIYVNLGESESLPWSASVTVPRFDPRKGLLPDAAIESLAATFEGRGTRSTAELRGQATLNGKTVYFEPLSGRIRGSILFLDQLTLLDPQRRGSLQASGEIRLPDSAAGQALSAKLQMSWRDVSLPREWVGQPLRSHGQLAAQGTLQNFAAKGAFALGPPGRLANIDVDLTGTPQEISIRRARIDEHTGELDVRGQISLKPQIGWKLHAQARRFDPGKIFAGWGGSIQLDLDSSGRMTAQGPDGNLELHELSGRLRGRTVAGRASLSIDPRQVLAGSAQLQSGQSAFELRGRRGDSLDLDLKFRIASLDDWIPKTSGSARGDFHVEGHWPLLAVRGSADGESFVFGQNTMKSLHIDAQLQNPRAPRGMLRLSAKQIDASGFNFNEVNAELAGDEHAHALSLAARGEPLSVDLKLHGARAGAEGWSGSLDALGIRVAGISPLALRNPVEVSWSPQKFSVALACLSGERIGACLQADQSQTRELHASFSLEHLPLGIVAALAAPTLPVTIEAVIEGQGHVRRAPDGAWFGEAHVSSPVGQISEAGGVPTDDASDALLTYRNFRLDATLAGDTASGAANAELNERGSLDAKGTLSALRSAAPSIAGQAKLSLPDLSPAGLFLPQLANVRGRGDASVQLAGALTAPQVTGSINLAQLSADVPQVGIALRDGELHAALSGMDGIEVTGKITSGDGSVSIRGHSDRASALKLNVTGKSFTAANLPGAKVIIDPELKFARSSDRMTLDGTVAIPTADIDFSKLPRQGRAQNASPDVVVIDDASTAAQAAKKIPLEVSVTVSLGSKVSVVGYGLDAKVTGLLKVHEVEDEDTTASGELGVSGKYKAYGQDLTIERGQIYYGGQRIDDPQVNLVATRTVQNVVAKLSVTGSAKKPILEVTADPAMPQTQALSYLVTGKPLSEVGSGEGDLVQSAARSLGGAAGNLLGKSLGKRLGISEIGVEDSAEAGGSAFTVGQYLSPRLYLSYGVGIFEPGQVVTLRYRISKRFSLEAVQGTLSQRAGVNYRVEK